MPDVVERFRTLSQMEVPDLWTDIRSRMPGPPPPEFPRRSRAVIAGAAFLAAVAGLVIAVRAFTGSAPAPAPAASAATSSPSPLSGRVADRIPIDGQVGAVLAASDGVWVHAYKADDQGVLVRVDPSTDQIEARIQLRVFPAWETGGGGMAFGDGSLWVTGGGTGSSDVEGVLQRIDPATGDVEATTWLGGRFGADVAVDRTGVWVALFRDPGAAEIVRIDPTTNDIVARIPLASDYVRRVAVVGGFVVVQEREAESIALQAIDASTNRVVATKRQVGDIGDTDAVVWNGELWAGFTRIDPATLDPLGPPAIGGVSLCCAILVAGQDGIWSVDTDRRLIRFDPVARVVQEVAPVPGSPIALAPDGDTVWVLNYDGSLTRVDLAG